MPDLQIATGDRFRDNCLKLLYKALIGDQTNIDEVYESRLAEKARKIEHYIHRSCDFTVNKKYKDTTRSKIWNLKDKKNPELRQNVVEGIIGEEEFAGMSSEAMASKERRRANKILRKNSLAQSIAVVETKSSRGLGSNKN
ncbi:8289_t:CDS:2 [Entrophospora sp. SA101]|nr:7485_t:CDS:2 [Entrophospora candida]CAH1762292.1 10252_t:CDS:2 [Entrophospora sp. SA101]CAJ0842504.1 8289_t:CDS:2 [Entrophospora sp. SA101]